MIFGGGSIALLALGSMVSCAEHIHEKLMQRGVPTSLVNLRFAKPLDLSMIGELAKTHSALVTLEENVERGGIGEEIECYVHEHAPSVCVLKIALPDAYVEHGDVTRLRSMLGIDSDSIIRKMEIAGLIPAAAADAPENGTEEK